LEAVAGGAYASDSLRDATRPLSARDAGLAGQIVFGSLRFQGQLDYLIARYAQRPVEELDLIVKIALRATIFQLRYLERIPAYAAVDEAVELVKRRKRAASGLTNAVLRKIDRAAVPWPDTATELSCPAWLLTRWSRHFDDAQARRIAEAALHEPIPYVRVPEGEPLPPGVEAEPTAVAGCYQLRSGSWPGMRLQDIGSQAIVPLLELRAGMRYLDLCAAPGNKMLQALEAPLQLAVACDISPRRIAEIPPVCPRVVLDATKPLPFGERFDRILIDAPCSGTGTLGRNPEIKWRITENDFARFAEMQIQIVECALLLLAPGGKLVYATCSLEREENEGVVEAVLAAHPELRREHDLWRLPGRDEGDGFYAALLR
jgi:16S rRNA (cytosine967-C5)-methyltransferase